MWPCMRIIDHVDRPVYPTKWSVDWMGIGKDKDNFDGPGHHQLGKLRSGPCADRPNYPWT